LKSIRGYAARHDLRIDLGSVPSKPVLLLTGWTDYAFSSDNVAHQGGLSLSPPELDVRGGWPWRPAITDIGIPVGRPQTIVVDLAPVLRGGSARFGSRRTCESTGTRSCWRPRLTSIRYGPSAQSVGGDPQESWVLAWSVGRIGTALYDYDDVSSNPMEGDAWPVREGDVRPLLEVRYVRDRQTW
jgi:hypothetical protein